MATWAVVLVCVTSGLNVVAAIFSAFFKGYAGKKGENLATHEDIEKVVEQVKAITKATKEIEVRIADRSASRNRLLEMRRTVAFDVTKHLALVYNLLGQFLSENEKLKSPEYVKADQALSTELEEMIRIQGDVSLVFDEPVPKAMKTFDVLARACRWDFVAAAHGIKDVREAPMAQFEAQILVVRQQIRAQLLE